MRYVKTLMVGAMALWLAGATVLAHQVTYKGTVIAVDAAKMRIQVKVLDSKTKKETPMDFGVTVKTKVLRGDKLVPFGSAQIKKDERISVTVNNDNDATAALTIRLAALK